MAAKRHYTIQCDGPGCNEEVRTNEAFVDKARVVACNWGWYKIGHSDQVGARDFCSKRCEDIYRVVNGG